MSNYYSDYATSGAGPAQDDPQPRQNEAPPVTRVIYGIPATNAPALSVPPSTRVCGGVVRFTNGDAAATETGGTARHSVSFDGNTGGSVLATMQRQGQHQTVELQPGNPASRTQLAVALREGLIRETAPGIYQDMAGAPEALAAAVNAPAEEPAAASDGAEHIDAEDEQDFARAIDPLPQHSYDAAVASAGLAVITGGDLSRAAADLAASAGIEPERARDYVEAGVAMHERTVARAVGLEGDRKAAFYEFTREHPRQLQEAVQRLVGQRDAGGFVELARQFKRAQPGDLTSWKAAGFETHLGIDGELMVRHGSRDWVMAKDIK